MRAVLHEMFYVLGIASLTFWAFGVFLIIRDKYRSRARALRRQLLKILLSGPLSGVEISTLFEAAARQSKLSRTLFYPAFRDLLTNGLIEMCFVLKSPPHPIPDEWHCSYRYCVLTKEGIYRAIFLCEATRDQLDKWWAFDKRDFYLRETALHKH